MADIVYKPTSAYSNKLNTAISKFNLLSGIMIYGKRICLNAAASRNAAGTGTVISIIYTIPQGKTFFYYASYLWTETASVGGNITSIICGTEVLLSAKCPTTAPTQVSLLQSFAIPLKFNSTEVIKLSLTSYNAGVNQCNANVVGYEIDDSMLPYFI